jgi:hypothetical protein
VPHSPKYQFWIPIVVAILGSVLSWGVLWGSTQSEINNLKGQVSTLELRNQAILEKLSLIEKDTAYIRGKLDGRR